MIVMLVLVMMVVVMLVVVMMVVVISTMSIVYYQEYIRGGECPTRYTSVQTLCAK